MHITNNSDISLPLAVWLVHDSYDYVRDKQNYISVTGLMKPLRHIVLPPLIPPTQVQPVDAADFIPSALGHSLHDSLEKAWVLGYETNLKKLGYPQNVIDRVKVNPKDEDLLSDTIPVYIEQRAFREITVDGVTYTIGGKFDMVSDGIVNDLKSTTVYTWVYGGKDDDYCKQGSLYRWLNPQKITEDYIRINFIFTDWQGHMARSDPNYPAKRVMHRDIPLMSEAETEAWIINKLRQIAKYSGKPETEVPECTNEELWMSDPKYKYYSNPASATSGGRSTKNFDTLLEANTFMAEKGGKGVVIPIIPAPKRCGYCDAFPICTQRNKYKFD